MLVVDLAMHTRRSWTLDDHTDARYGPYVGPLTWSPDEQRVALDHRACCAYTGRIFIMDTRLPAGPLLPKLHQVPDPNGRLGDSFEWSPAGLLTATFGDNSGCPTGDLIAVDPFSGTTLRTYGQPDLARSEAISSDITGHHVLIYTGQDLYRLDNHTLHRLMALPWDVESAIHPLW